MKLIIEQVEQKKKIKDGNWNWTGQDITEDGSFSSHGLRKKDNTSRCIVRYHFLLRNNQIPGLSCRMTMTWFGMVKSFFVSEQQPRVEKKARRRGWIFRLLKIKRLAPLSETSPPRKLLIQGVVEVEQRQSALLSYVARQIPSSDESDHQHEKALKDSAAIIIQAFFRSYLARKALRALRGVVKLQALIRGWAVRQQAMNTFKCLQSIVNLQSEVCSKRCERTKDMLHCQEFRLRGCRQKDINVDLNSQRKWDASTLTKEELKTLFLTKREASVKKERIREYYLSHRRSAETERDKVYGRRKYWLEQWVDTQLAKSENLKNSENARDRDQVGDGLPRLKHLPRQYQADMLLATTNIPRRTYHHRKQRSTGDDTSLLGSPSLPAYMASTESAKAKTRSLSTPRLRPLSFDVCSDITSPYKYGKLSPISSINSELPSSTWVDNFISSSQRSLYLRGMPSPMETATRTYGL